MIRQTPSDRAKPSSGNRRLPNAREIIEPIADAGKRVRLYVVSIRLYVSRLRYSDRVWPDSSEYLGMTAI